MLVAPCSAEVTPDQQVRDVGRGTMLLKQRKWIEARAVLEAAAASEPKSAEAHHQLAVVLALTKEYHRARETFERSLRLETGPFRPFIQFNLGALGWHVGTVRKDDSGLDEARIYLANAAADVPALGLATDLIGFTWTIGRKSTLLTVDVAGLPPDTAIFAETAGEGEGTVYLFGDQGVPPLYFYGSPSSQALLASAMSDRSAYMEQLSAVLRALRREPPSEFNAILTWAILIAKTEFIERPEQFDEAIADLSEAISLGLPFPKPHTFLGMIYVHQGRYAEARGAANKALALDPNYARAKQLLAIVEERSSKSRSP